MRNIFPASGIVLSLMVVAVPPAVAAPGDGYMWEYTSTMDMEGMQMKMPPTQRCMPAAKPEKTPPMQGDCKMDKLETEGDTTRFEMSCGNPTEMRGSGTSTLTDTSMEGTYTMVSDDGEMKMHIRGERKGPCDTSAPQPMMKGMPPGMMPPR